jgi:hypothetical protein
MPGLYGQQGRNHGEIVKLPTNIWITLIKQPSLFPLYTSRLITKAYKPYLDEMELPTHSIWY